MGGTGNLVLTTLVLLFHFILLHQVWESLALFSLRLTHTPREQFVLTGTCRTSRGTLVQITQNDPPTSAHDLLNVRTSNLQPVTVRREHFFAITITF